LRSARHGFLIPRFVFSPSSMFKICSCTIFLVGWFVRRTNSLRIRIGTSSWKAQRRFFSTHRYSSLSLSLSLSSCCNFRRWNSAKQIPVSRFVPIADLQSHAPGSFAGRRSVLSLMISILLLRGTRHNRGRDVGGGTLSRSGVRAAVQEASHRGR
jgi:hypothetical protein